MAEVTILEFDLELKKEPVKIRGELYSVSELDGVELGKWRTEMGDRLRISTAGVVSGVKDFTGLEASLICRCLRNAKGELIPRSVVEKWPTTAQQSLFQICRKLNGLTDESEAAEKKS